MEKDSEVQGKDICSPYSKVQEPVRNTCESSTSPSTGSRLDRNLGGGDQSPAVGPQVQGRPDPVQSPDVVPPVPAEASHVQSPDGVPPVPVASSSPLPKPCPSLGVGDATDKRTCEVLNVEETKEAKNDVVAEEITAADEVSMYGTNPAHPIDVSDEDIDEAALDVQEISSHQPTSVIVRNKDQDELESSTSKMIKSNILLQSLSQDLDAPSVPAVESIPSPTPSVMTTVSSPPSPSRSLKTPQVSSTPSAPPKALDKVHKDQEAVQSPVESTESNANIKRKLDFQDREPKPRKKRISSTKRAGLVLSVSRINRRIKAGRYARRTGFTAGVYMAAVLEYLVAEILELAGNCARYFRKQRIFPRCIQLTLLHDKELFQLTRGAIVPQGGVKPFIHPALQPNVTARTGDDQAPDIATNWE